MTGAVKQGVTSALDRLSRYQPAWKFAVVYDWDRWNPVQPPAGSQWDYEPYISGNLAREALTDPRPGMSDCELWERRDGQWEQVA